MPEKLAIISGPKAVTTPKTCWPNFNEITIKVVEELLRSGKVNY